MTFLIVWILFGIGCGIAASNKKRSVVGWFILGMLLGPFGLLFILVLRPLSEPAEPSTPITPWGWGFTAIVILILLICFHYATQPDKPQPIMPRQPIPAEPPTSAQLLKERNNSSRQMSESQITREQIVEYFSKDLKFTFGKEFPIKSDMEVIGHLGNEHAGQFVELEVIYNSYNSNVKEVVMIISPINSVNNKNLVYISRLLEKVVPDIQNRDYLIKKGISEALQKNWTTLTVGGKELSFSYIKDAGGVKGDNPIIFGCDLTATPKLQPIGQKINVNFTVEPKTLDGRVQLVGKTNLPDGTDLMVSLKKGKNYMAQSKTKVFNGGLFSTDFFRNKDGGPLNDGKYNISIIVPYAAVQDDSVKKIIGKHGEMLTGQYVHSESMGNTVTYNSSIIVKQEKGVITQSI